MGDFVSGIPWGDFSWPALLGLVVLLIIRGDIVPRKTYEDMRRERDEWRTTAIKALEVNDKTLVAAETGAAVLDALPKPEV